MFGEDNAISSYAHVQMNVICITSHFTHSVLSGTIQLTLFELQIVKNALDYRNADGMSFGAPLPWQRPFMPLISPTHSIGREWQLW
jgi:hypothetical protein